MKKKNQRRQFLFNTEWIPKIIVSTKYLHAEYGHQDYVGIVVKLINTFQSDVILNEKYSIETLENTDNDWYSFLENWHVLKCCEPMEKQEILNVFIDEIIPDIIENEKKYRGKIINTLKEQIKKLEKNT